MSDELVERLAPEERASSVADAQCSPVETIATDEGDTRLTCLPIPEKELHDLASLGIYVRRKGVSKILCGAVVIQQERLNAIIQVLMKSIMDLANKKRKTASDRSSIAQLSNSLGSLSGRLIDAERFLLEIEGSLSVGEPEELLNKSFLPGQKVSIPGKIAEPSNRSLDLEPALNSTQIGGGTRSICS